jgi:hypothetical protein
MRRLLKATGIFFGALFGSMIAFGGGMPTVPSVPAFSDPAAIVSTLNTLMATLQGAGTAINNNTPAVYSTGAYCTASGATPQTCNTQRGSVTFTGVTVTNAATATLVVNNSLLTAASACTANITNNANPAQSTPFVSTLTSGSGTLTAILGNGSATTTGSVSIILTFNCVQ